MTRWLTIAICALLALGAAACGDDSEGGGGGGGGGDLKGTIAIDGSSTVQPFAQAALELFQEENPDVRITVGGAGTGDGFEKFCRGELDIADASREIEEEETAACKKANVSYSQVQVANDGIAVVSNKSLPVKCMKTAQLKELYAPKSKIKNYSELGSGIPNKPVSLFSPGSESGTFDFFTETVLETDAEQREANVQTSPDDNVLVTGVSGEANALGYFGFSFYDQNKDKLNLVSGGRRRRLCRPVDQVDPGRQLQAAVAAAVHVPEQQGDREAGGQGLHGLRGQEPGSDLEGSQDRADDV